MHVVHTRRTLGSDYVTITIVKVPRLRVDSITGLWNYWRTHDCEREITRA
jgi:hypothetical protein